MFESIYDMIKKDPRYKFQAYAFILTALELARKQTGKKRHVTAIELLQGFKELAHKEYGIMAISVLESWGVTTTDDVGEIVFNLIDAKLLSKTDEDKKEDFHNVFDFNKVFNDEYVFPETKNNIKNNK